MDHSEWNLLQMQLDCLREESYQPTQATEPDAALLVKVCALLRGYTREAIAEALDIAATRAGVGR